MYSVYRVYSVYSVYSVYGVYSVYSVYCVYSVYSVNGVYSVSIQTHGFRFKMSSIRPLLSLRTFAYSIPMHDFEKISNSM